MIFSLLFLFVDLPPVYQEFEEVQFFSELEENYDRFVGESLLGSIELTDYLFENNLPFRPEPIPLDFQLVLQKYAKPSSTIIDYGAGNGVRTLFLARLVGPDGHVLSFEKNRERFRSLFWNLRNKNLQFARIFCPQKGDFIDQYDVENVSLMILDAKGQELNILRGARETIHRWKPTLLLNLFDGVSLERGEHYLVKEFNRRRQELSKLGYTMERFQDNWYLAKYKREDE